MERQEYWDWNTSTLIASFETFGIRILAFCGNFPMQKNKSLLKKLYMSKRKSCWLTSRWKETSHLFCRNLIFKIRILQKLENLITICDDVESEARKKIKTQFLENFPQTICSLFSPWRKKWSQILQWNVQLNTVFCQKQIENLAMSNYQVLWTSNTPAAFSIAFFVCKWNAVDRNLAGKTWSWKTWGWSWKNLKL